MLVFPQLSSGAVAQAPISRLYYTPTVVNTLDDGRQVCGSLDGEAVVKWSLKLQGLSDAELEAIEQLYSATCGRAGNFLFLDPAGNLLEWSEDISRNSWQKGAMLQLQAGIADPYGGSRAARATNGGQSAQELAQRVVAPARFQYCLSVYARAATACSAALAIRSADHGRVAEQALVSDWRRVVVSGSPGGDGEWVDFAVSIPAGATVDLFGLQAEAHPNASPYARTAARGGSYPGAYFDQDTLRIESAGPSNHGTQLWIASPAED